MARKPVLIITAVLALATAGAVGASVSAWAGGSSTPAIAKPAPPLHPKTVNGTVRPFVAATNVQCGENVTASVTLNGDLFCANTALFITKASVTLNLNGHTIGGTTGQGDGVSVQANSDVVENGVVTGFDIGVSIGADGPTPTSDTVTKIRATYNAFGIWDRGAKAKITANTVYASQYNGIEEGGSGATLSGNRATSNAGYGISVSSAQGILVSGNEADSNLANGIATNNSDGTTLTGNVANFNKDDGIVTGDRDTIDGGGNLAKGNDYATGVAPEQCSGVACS